MNIILSAWKAPALIIHSQQHTVSSVGGGRGGGGGWQMNVEERLLDCACHLIEWQPDAV